MDLKEVAADESTLAILWLLTVASSAAVIWRIQIGIPGTGATVPLWSYTGPIATLLVLVLFVAGLGFIWLGGPLVLGRLLAGLAILYAPLHLVIRFDLLGDPTLLAQLRHIRDAIYPLLTIMAAAILIRSVLYTWPAKR